MEGTVSEVLPDTRYRVTLENGHVVVAYVAGKDEKHRITNYSPGTGSASS